MNSEIFQQWSTQIQLRTGTYPCWTGKRFRAHCTKFHSQLTYLVNRTKVALLSLYRAQPWRSLQSRDNSFQVCTGQAIHKMKNIVINMTGEDIFNYKPYNIMINESIQTEQLISANVSVKMTRLRIRFLLYKEED